MQTSSPSVTHAYLIKQKVSVSLTVTNQYGCYNTIVKNEIIDILDPLTADFEVDQSIICRITDEVQFTNKSAGPGVLSYLWDFGDGNTSQDANPQHSYAEPGSYQVSLTVTDSTSLTDTSSQMITVSVDDTELELTLQRKVRTRTGSTIVDLRWTGTAEAVDVYRDDQLVDTTEDNGRYRDRFTSMAATVTYKICVAGTDTCSAELDVNF